MTFDAQGGTGASPASKVVTNGAAYGTLATTARTGYTFAGWWTGAGGTGTEVTSGTTVALTGAQTLYAKWTGNPYTVTFDAQGGTGASPASKVVTNGAAYGALATTARAGYTFAGWWTGAGGTGTEVTSGTTVALTGAQTLYAKWVQIQAQLEVVAGENFGVVSNWFGFSINWASGQVVVVDACTNLINPVWSPLQTNVLSNTPTYFSDPKWTNIMGRFYRIRAP